MSDDPLKDYHTTSDTPGPLFGCAAAFVIIGTIYLLARYAVWPYIG